MNPKILNRLQEKNEVEVGLLDWGSLVSGMSCWTRSFPSIQQVGAGVQDSSNLKPISPNPVGGYLREYLILVSEGFRITLPEDERCYTIVCSLCQGLGISCPLGVFICGTVLGDSVAQSILPQRCKGLCRLFVFGGSACLSGTWAFRVLLRFFIGSCELEADEVWPKGLSSTKSVHMYACKSLYR